MGGDGGPAISGGLPWPTNIYFHPVTKDLFISHYKPIHVIRRISRKTGIITTIAGQAWKEGYSGDGGPALEATFNTPQSIAIDPVTHEILVPDSINRVLR